MRTVTRDHDCPIPIRRRTVTPSSQEQSASVVQTANAVQRLSESISSIAQGNQEQATSIINASTTVNQVSTAIAQMAGFAEEAGGGAQQAIEAAGNGMIMMARTNEVITNIRLTVDITSQQIKNLGEQSMETCKIVAVIDDIAAQTSEVDTSRDTDVKLRHA